MSGGFCYLEKKKQAKPESLQEGGVVYAETIWQLTSHKNNSGICSLEEGQQSKVILAMASAGQAGGDYG